MLLGHVALSTVEPVISNVEEKNNDFTSKLKVYLLKIIQLKVVLDQNPTKAENVVFVLTLVHGF